MPPSVTEWRAGGQWSPTKAGKVFVRSAPGDGPTVLIAHDIGTSVTTELLARDIEGTLGFELQRAVLTNGSVILARASLRPIQKILQRSSIAR